MEGQQPPSIDICKGQNLLVRVEEAYPDMVLVSYHHGTQVFQGVLLDSSKGRLPCGIYPPGGVFPPPPPADTSVTSENDDKLFAVKQRHTYYQQDPATDTNSKSKKGVQLRQSISLTQRFKNSRMTVRLRPRQVLCSKCQSICNEKSENVSGAKGQRATEGPTPAKQTTETRSSSRSSRDRNIQDQTVTSNNRKSSKSPQKNVRLVPKLVKLKPSEIETATSKGVSCLKKNSSRGSRNDPNESESEGETGVNPSYSVSGNDISSDGRVPKLKLSTNLCISDAGDSRRKGRIPKMTISTLNFGVSGNENSKENFESESGDVKLQSIPKMILSTSGLMNESSIGDKRDKESGKSRKQSELGESHLDSKELKLRSGNIHKVTLTTTGHQEFSDCLGDRISPIPKLTILPLIPKKDSQSDDSCEIKHHKMGRGSPDESHAEKMSLRKKRSLGSMEDLWDESVFDEATKKHKREESEDNLEGSDNQDLACEDSAVLEGDKPKTTPVLKISFGPEGKGTVLKIPSKSTVVTINNPEIDTEEEITRKYKDMSAKAAKKALKKAKKEAQKKTVLGGASPAYMVGGMSPRFGGMSPLRLGGMSPARLGSFSPARFGGTSPARFGGMSPARAAAVDLSTRDLPPKKHKHKVKHKKKHKDERRHKLPDENKVQVEVKGEAKDASVHAIDSAEPDIPVENITPELQWNTERTDNYTDQSPPLPQRQNSLNLQPASNLLQPSRHKLSISIKRVSNASYVACDSSHSDGERTVTPTNPSCSDDILTNNPQAGKCDPYNIGEKSPLAALSTEAYVKCGAHSEVLASFHVEGASTESLGYPAEDRQEQASIGAGPYGMETPEPSLAGSTSPCSDDPGSIPDFPTSIDGGEEQPSAALLMRLSWQEVQQCQVSDGRVMAVGDVVWGKIHGFPWWPAKVMAIRVLQEGSRDTKWQQAHVSWYGSSTSSMMPASTLQPFLKMFKMRYNKRKRGPYREAIKQATSEAEQTDSEVKCREEKVTVSNEVDYHMWERTLGREVECQEQEVEQTMARDFEQETEPMVGEEVECHHREPEQIVDGEVECRGRDGQQHAAPEHLLGASPREVDVVS
ncbi:hypothetical protein Pmani_017741 [Petrolisthes manimaculis]|uniref:PWWP domain-containing protein n=1 Tax=Petrolisthes manimaculis TaxID=1843537 RepID=A0AAE1U5H8_9EUCA|nr:hypothetical protein Pmani_017741 [Petrolisthes manimaculis]